ncbi:MAG: relaxase [Litorimonas sp.]
MILVGSQRGGAKNLALHLLKQDNEHVEVHQVRGFVSDSVMGALNEAYATSKATRCRKFLYSLSINPPANQKVSTDDFLSAIDRSEKALGLKGQPRVVVFHEKEGRRHAHCVWSRIDTAQMKAVHIAHDKRRLVSITRDLFIENGWRMPQGLINSENRNPTNYSLAEYQQAKRVGRKAAEIKADFQSAWAQSDCITSFRHALREHGYWLAKGDRRGFVALDHNLKPFSISRWVGLKSKEIAARLGKPDDRLSDVETVTQQIQSEMSDSLHRLSQSVERRSREAQERFEARRRALVKKQKAERLALTQAQTRKWEAASKERQTRFNRGLSGIWDRLRGEHRRIRKQNEREAFEQLKADQNARETMIWRHLQERQRTELFKLRYRERAQSITEDIQLDKRIYQHPQLPGA